MSYAACKVPINDRMNAALNSFHTLRELKGWKALDQPQRDDFNLRAIKIEKAALELYEPLVDEMANAIDGRA